MLTAALSKAQSFDTTFSKTIEVPGISQQVLTDHALKFGEEQRRFLLANDRTKDKIWMLGRVSWWNNKNFQLRLLQDKERPGELTAHIVIGYRGAVAGGCIQQLVIFGRITVRIEEGAATILVDKIRYNHFNTGAPPGMPDLEGNGICGNNGTLSELYQCRACPKSTEAAIKFMRQSIEGLFSDLELFLKSE